MPVNAATSSFDAIKDVPAWLQGIGTVVAFGWSVYLLRLDRKLDRKKEKEDDTDFSRALLIMLNHALDRLHEGVVTLHYESRDDFTGDTEAFEYTVSIMKEEVDSIISPFLTIPMKEWPSYELHALFSNWVREYKDLYWREKTAGNLSPERAFALRMSIGRQLGDTLKRLDRLRREIEVMTSVAPLPYAKREPLETEKFDENGERF